MPNLSSASKIMSKVSSESRPNSSKVLSGLMVATSISNFFAIAFDTISNEFMFLSLNVNGAYYKPWVA